MQIRIPFGSETITASVPDGTHVLRMSEPSIIENCAEAFRRCLAEPIGSRPLISIASEKLQAAKDAGHTPSACIVISDNTRPVPYAGDDGLLKPVLAILEEAGFEPGQITILIACGTHRPMEPEEIRKTVGDSVFGSGVKIVNHNCRDPKALVKLGRTERGTEVEINRIYAGADLKILTGLVESHFMAGVSGGRKSVCPGIFGEKGTYIFHGPELMGHENARDLVLEGNPVHEESLAVAKKAGADFIVNVTLNSEFQITGIFCGDLEKAHEKAAEHLNSYVSIPVGAPYDFVITHGGFVAVNHYQAAKAAVAALGAVKEGGTILEVADNSDKNCIGSDRYRLTLSLLKQTGPAAFERCIKSPDWAFLPEQWQVQLWARVFKKIPMNNYIYYAPQPDDKDWRDIPGRDGRIYLPRSAAEGSASLRMPAAEGSASLCLSAAEKTALVVESAVRDYLSEHGYTDQDVKSGRCRIAYLSDGPYGIPVQRK